jgi:hypothetical protein
MIDRGIDCTQNWFGKSLLPGFMAIVGVIFIAVDIQPFLWVLWAAMLPYILVYSPDFTVHQDGIEVRFPWKTVFNRWDEITKVRKTDMNIRIYARNLTVINIVFSFGNPWIVATAPGRTNYDAAIAAIKRNIGDRFHESRY